jgi:hypothetical protein
VCLLTSIPRPPVSYLCAVCVRAMQDGSTVLYAACERGDSNQEYVQALVTAGAGTEFADSVGVTALICGALHGAPYCSSWR